MNTLKLQHLVIIIIGSKIQEYVMIKKRLLFPHYNFTSEGYITTMILV